MSDELFYKTFDGVSVPFIFNDMVLWVGMDEVSKILRVPTHSATSLPDNERTILKQLQPCSDSNKVFITSLGVGLLASRSLSRGCVINDCVTNDSHLPEHINAFANIFLTDVVIEMRQEGLLCSINSKANDILNILNSNTPGV
ncbi:polyhedron envelope protein [Epinotia aporema granulovirus]|uniref:Polyhedron envelope protein n=1 Tax=Epinotia aporema granulovirus TaxID=166056 RepID=K4EQ15_9BBAC|nr:polyhedron envelope protein [Epinotia aporema granulovirus]AER41447.1 polyhedron envelope protein [Epinotia aporema granulovirus]